MTYDEKISLLNGEDFFALFEACKAAPRWVNSNGKKAIQLIGKCHCGEHYSALFDPTTGKCNCFSQCGRGMLLHTWVTKALQFSSPKEGKDFIESWIENRDISFEGRTPLSFDTEYVERKFIYEPNQTEILPSMPQEALNELYQKFDTSMETLKRLRWVGDDGIDPKILHDFDIAYYPDPEHKSIILPHHNIKGEIVGIYERSFRTLRSEFKKQHPEFFDFEIRGLPKAKYVPLVRDEKWVVDNRKSWSFPNTKNLYGLHKAKDYIQQTGKAIIFEGAKSVMLAHQYGYPYAVASHTYGANVHHIAMLLDCGAREIILAFDKQFKDKTGQEWELYERKTKDLANQIKEYCDVSRIVDIGNLLKYKDAPIDEGKDIFDYLFMKREFLVKNMKNLGELPIDRMAFKPTFSYKEIERRVAIIIGQTWRMQ